MQPLQDLARKLLTDKAVQVVIGYEEGPRGVRPVFLTNPDQADRLVFNTRCVQNLATYLSPRRAHLTVLGKRAVVVKGCDARAVAGLLRETQISRDNVVLIGVRCGGVVRDPAGDGTLSEKTVSDRCGGCEAREPKLADHWIGDLPPPPPASGRDALIARIDAMSAQERWDFWMSELGRCIRCHACREVCPMCFCDRCVADKSQPQWIESSSHPRANLAWQMVRVLHQAGRCADCGECERACPADIPLGLLARKVAQTIEQRFNYHVTDDPAVAAPIGTYRLDDQQEFIL
jgi:formate dehydrogenase (coenzyme F420) beta subunit